jgi:hypothetical protein
MDLELKNTINNLENKIDKIILLLYNNNLIKENILLQQNNNNETNIISNNINSKKKQEPSTYNKFMKKEFERLKIENPELCHKERFKIAAQLWRNSNENPKNK